MSKKEVSIEIDGKLYSLETGRLAKFANGAVMARCGDTMVLVTAVASLEEKKDIDYLPLQVEYREKTASAGKIPGGFLKREGGRPSDHEILSGRLIDRPIRPLIPQTWSFDTQIIATVFSSDPNIDPDSVSAIGASAALMISDIPFHGPISEVKVGRVKGQFVLNPSFQQLLNSDIDISVAGTDTSIVMVEGESKEISEDDFIKALEFAHENIIKLNQLQKDLAIQIEVKKREFVENEAPEDLVSFIKDLVYNEIDEFVHKISTKAERNDWRAALKEKITTLVQENWLPGKTEENEEYPGLDLYINEIIYKLEKKAMRFMILDDKIRLDGRGLTDIRPISCEIGILPRAHGSALFTRGETQSLSTTTLGTKTDAKMVDGLLPVYTNPFMLHYNFPPFCTGETGRTGVGRREIGHGNLAERALKNMIPSQIDFPYTIRVVSDILESNGSSSMATVCAGCLSLFDAGVPMKKPIAGIAMGLIKEDEKVAVLSDILGDEDHLGDMDFKVTGSTDGITACQMDIKIEGISLEIMKTALDQAKLGRLHILDKMNEVIETPKTEVSPYAPRFTTIHVPTDTIGAVIGTGGETIRAIVAETGTTVNIDENGTVLIGSTSQEAADRATEIIYGLTRKPQEGEVYSGRVKEVREGLGAIIEFLPKHQGLLHISQISYERIANVGDVLSVGDIVEIKLLEVTRDGKYRLSRKALLPKPEGYVEEARRDDRRPERRDDRRYDRRDDRRHDDRRGSSRPYGRDRDDSRRDSRR